MTMSHTDEILNTAEAAKLLKYDPTTVRAYAANGTIPATLIGGRWRFSRAKLIELIEQTTQTRKEIPQA